MERRKFVIGLGSLAAGGAAAAGTGAFDLTRADRDFTVQVSGDESAYLGLESGPEGGEESPYAEVNGDTLEIDFSGDMEEQNGDGLNEGADSRFDNVFTITNNGTQDVPVRLVDEEDGVSVWDEDLPAFYWSEDDDPNFDGDHDFGNGARPVLGPGESVTISIIFWGLSASDPAGRYDETDLDKAEDQEFIGLYVDASDA